MADRLSNFSGDFAKLRAWLLEVSATTELRLCHDVSLPTEEANDAFKQDASGVEGLFKSCEESVVCMKGLSAGRAGGRSGHRAGGSRI